MILQKYFNSYQKLNHINGINLVSRIPDNTDQNLKSYFNSIIGVGKTKSTWFFSKFFLSRNVQAINAIFRPNFSAFGDVAILLKKFKVEMFLRHVNQVQLRIMIKSGSLKSRKFLFFCPLNGQKSRANAVTAGQFFRLSIPSNLMYIKKDLQSKMLMAFKLRHKKKKKKKKAKKIKYTKKTYKHFQQSRKKVHGRFEVIFGKKFARFL